MTQLVLIGPHRTGKTTTAKKIAEEYDEFEFVPVSAYQIHEDMGIAVGQDIDYNTRFELQRRLLDKFTRMSLSAHKEGRNVVTDRSPMDFAAYTVYYSFQYMRKSIMEPTLSDSYSIVNQLHSYVSECHDIFNTYVDKACLFPPIVVGPESPKSESIDAVRDIYDIFKILQKHDWRNLIHIPDYVMNLDDRVEFCYSAALTGMECKL